MEKLVLKIKKLYQGATIPTYAYGGDAGMDLYCRKDFVIKLGKRINVGTGVAIELPAGFVGLIWDKSGLSVKRGLHIMSGVIDAGFRGEIRVTILNTSRKKYQFKKGEKIAQMLIQKVHQAKFKLVEKLGRTQRGTKTKGSSGR